MTEQQYIKEAYLEALRNSTDPSTQNGAIIVEPDGIIIAKGANHFPFGVKERTERWERPAKYMYVEHAERNAIYDAAFNGKSTYGTTMYVPWFACADCARAIIQAGIRHVVGHRCSYHDNASDSWKESVEVGLTMFKEAGVVYSYIEGKMGLHIRFNGKLVEV